MQKGISDEKTSALYFSSHHSPTFWKKTKRWTVRDPCIFSQLFTSGKLSEGQRYFLEPWIYYALFTIQMFFSIIVLRTPKILISHFYFSINNPLCR